VPAQIAERYGWPVGVYVGSVQPGGAADAAGIRQGDIIVSFDGTEGTTVAELNGLKEGHKAGDAVEVKIFRTKTSPNLRLQCTGGGYSHGLGVPRSGETLPNV
jgi:serine protease Do